MARKTKADAPVQIKIRHQAAAMQLALGLTVTQASIQSGVPKGTLEKWLPLKWFQELVAQYKAEGEEKLKASVLDFDVASRAARVATYNEDFNALGHRIRDLRELADERELTEIERRELFTAIQKRADIAKQAAQDLGQWTQRFSIKDLTDEQLVTLLEQQFNDNPGTSEGGSGP